MSRGLSWPLERAEWRGKGVVGFDLGGEAVDSDSVTGIGQLR
jgi:hypothetical protein